MGISCAFPMDIRRLDFFFSASAADAEAVLHQLQRTRKGLLFVTILITVSVNLRSLCLKKKKKYRLTEVYDK